MQPVQQLITPRTPRGNRLIALIVMLGCAAPLVVASMLTPSASGTGTHMQMGLPDCGFKAVTGYPCATCGCTTAFAHAADGSLLQSLLTQPFGAVLAVALAMAVWIGMWGVWSGMPVGPVFSLLSNRWIVIAWVALLFGAWAYKAGLVLAAS